MAQLVIPRLMLMLRIAETIAAIMFFHLDQPLARIN